jgi:hypothetical protein
MKKIMTVLRAVAVLGLGLAVVAPSQADCWGWTPFTTIKYTAQPAGQVWTDPSVTNVLSSAASENYPQTYYRILFKTNALIDARQFVFSTFDASFGPTWIGGANMGHGTVACGATGGLQSY